MTNLSPAAQAVLTQIKTQWHSDPEEESFNVIMAGLAAAALRAVADQVAPLSTNRRQDDIRQKLLAIAAELEGQ